jgi:hypothetical protein
MASQFSPHTEESAKVPQMACFEILITVKTYLEVKNTISVTS